MNGSHCEVLVKKKSGTNVCACVCVRVSVRLFFCHRSQEAEASTGPAGSHVTHLTMSTPDNRVRVFSPHHERETGKQGNVPSQSPPPLAVYSHSNTLV